MVTNKELQKKLKDARVKIKELNTNATAPGVVNLRVGSVVMLPNCDDWAFKLSWIDHRELDLPRLEFIKIYKPGEEPKE